MKHTIEIGMEYGYLTVLKEVARNKFGHRQYLVRCRCGKVEEVEKAKLTRPNCACIECSRRMHHQNMIESRIGMEINGFKILSGAGMNGNGSTLYKCKCLKCGAIVVKTLGALGSAKGQGCVNCKPDYHFQVSGDIAIGELKDGTKFIIDASMIPLVNQYRLKFRKDKGYIFCYNGEKRNCPLHRVLFGLTKDDKFLVDHINRNRLDCRMSNLRIATMQQNSMNRSMQPNNTSGYVGVTYNKRDNRYIAKIGLNNWDIFLYRSTDILECASAYNYASELLFKDYVGYRNDAPPASKEMRKIVEARCSGFFDAAERATRPVILMDEKKQEAG